MVYQILLVISIVFIALGIILAGVSVYVFRKRNMAEVYDSLLNRGYVQKIEKRKNKKTKKYENASKAVASDMNDSIPKVNISINSVSDKHTSTLTQPLKNNIDYSSNSGYTTPLNVPSDGKEGLTTMLETQISNENFKIVEELYYSFSKETI